MEYNGITYYVCNWLPFWQALTLNSKRVILHLVFDETNEWIHIPSTCDVMQHEEQHCKDIVKHGWIDFMVTEGWHMWILGKKHDVAAYEPDAEKAELNPNPTELEQLIINYCKVHNLKYYY